MASVETEDPRKSTLGSVLDTPSIPTVAVDEEDEPGVNVSGILKDQPATQTSVSGDIPPKPTAPPASSTLSTTEPSKAVDISESPKDTGLLGNLMESIRGATGLTADESESSTPADPSSGPLSALTSMFTPTEPQPTPSSEATQPAEQPIAPTQPVPTQSTPTQPEPTPPADQPVPFQPAPQALTQPETLPPMAPQPVPSVAPTQPVPTPSALPSATQTPTMFQTPPPQPLTQPEITPPPFTPMTPRPAQFPTPAVPPPTFTTNTTPFQSSTFETPRDPSTLLPITQTPTYSTPFPSATSQPSPGQVRPGDIITPPPINPPQPSTFNFLDETPVPPRFEPEEEIEIEPDEDEESESDEESDEESEPDIDADNLVLTAAMDKISKGEIFEGDKPFFQPYDILPWWGWAIVFFLLGVAFITVVYFLFYQPTDPTPEPQPPQPIAPIPAPPQPQPVPPPDNTRKMYCLIGEDQGRKVVIRVSDPSLCRRTVLLTDEEYENAL